MNKQPKYIPTVCAIALTAYGCSVHSAPGVLADKPLFLGTDVQPNIFWLVDDSGSMDWEVLLSERAQVLYSSAPNRGNIDFTPDNNEERRELCAAHNVMAYDPTRTYTPWVGVDENSYTYSDKTLTTALNNPYDNDDIDNVSTHYYFVWNDANNNDQYDSGECPTSFANRIYVNTLSSDQQTNYANWYSYYRKREYVAKRAISQIVDSSQARMGLATLHNNNSVATEVDDIDDISVPIDTDAQTNKLNLLRQLFRINSSGSTPLRRTLEEAGEYFKIGATSDLFSASTTSPILPADEGGECQQNFTILMSDGYWNGSDPSVGNADGDNSSEFDGISHTDTYSNTLADVAMNYYETDLATSMDNNVPVIAGVDENTAQHMVTYTVAFGINGTLSNDPTDRETAFTWPEPEASSPTSIDDMRHAAWNGRGKFLNAGSPDTLISSLQSAVNDIAERDGAASAVAFNSTSLGTDTLVFQARFNSGGWHGDLSAFTFDSNGLGPLQWNAGDELSDRDLTSEPRQIVTFNGTQGVAFQFPVDYTNPTATEIQSAQLSDLLADAPSGSEQVYGDALVDYLRGERTYEGGICSVGSSSEGGSNIGGIQFRFRDCERLGDIVHSSPEYVGAPATPFPNLIEGVGNEYSTFISDQASRTPTVYVGANDGMLHAFRASDGHELFAYVPGLIYDSSNGRGLHYLADSDYSHIAYVDDSPRSGDLFVDGSWKTYLVGGLRAGGKGIYVLDITNPSQLTEANASSIVVQEFTHNDLGYTFSRPQIVKMNNGRWAAVFGNGYNNTGDGKAKLFVLYLDSTGGYQVIDTGVGSIAGSDCNATGSDCNGLSTPSLIDMNSDGTIDRAYAGDLHGNLWAFDLTNASANNWDSAYLDESNNPTALFQGCTTDPCTSSSRQPITSAPVIKTHPDRVASSTEPNLMVYFGTGQYIASTDNLTSNLESMYGIWDSGNASVTRARLQVQTISDSSTVTGGRDLTTNAVDYNLSGTPEELGWYIDLPDTGERIVVETAVIGDIVFFNTMVPDTSSCNGGGYGYLMAADRMSGGQPDITVFDYDNDGVFDDDVIAGYEINAIPSGSRIIDGLEVFSDSSGAISDIAIQTSEAKASSRASWTTFK